MILALDETARQARTEVEQLRAEQNRISKGKVADPEQIGKLRAMKATIQEKERELNALEQQIEELLLYVPNPAHPGVPVGADETGNQVVRLEGEPRPFSFQPRTHLELGETLGLFDFARAAKISGSRFAILAGWGPRLQRALVSYMLDRARENGYVELATPYLVRREAMTGTANLPKFEDDAFRTDDDLFLIPTAEVPVTNYYREEILSEEQLPLAHVAHTPCFRKEAGAAGKDTRGFIRLHQFDKVELVRFVHPDNSLDELEKLTSHAESVLSGLGLHYRVLLMCTGDMGFAQWKKYDLEAWAPGMERFLEVSSCSVFGDFQARRAGIRFRPASGKLQYVHTLNGSALAVPRTMVALLETWQQEDSTVVVPEVLVPYLGVDHIGLDNVVVNSGIGDNQHPL